MKKETAFPAADEGHLVLGKDVETGSLRTVPLTRAAWTIASSRHGKGVAQIIPTVRQWPFSCLVIDPKAETVKNSIEQRLEMGQDVAILDPTGIVAGRYPDLAEYVRSWDPLSLVSQDQHASAGYRRLLAIAEGIVMRSGQEKEPHWNDQAEAIIAGLLAYQFESKLEPIPYLARLPGLISDLRSELMRDDLVGDLERCKMFSGLAGDIAATFKEVTNETHSILTTTGRHVRFLRDEDIALTFLPSAGEHQGLELDGLRDGTLTCYLVIDPDALGLHARYLRLFVRMALSVMMETTFSEGKSDNRPCLFCLDEAFSIGRLDDLARASGLLPGAGVRLFGVLQDWGQLVSLYGEHTAETFLANSDVVSVFGVSDDFTLKKVSGWWGNVSADEVLDDALKLASNLERSTAFRNALGGKTASRNEKLSVALDICKARIGHPRMPPDELQYKLGRHGGKKLAHRIAVRYANGPIELLEPAPFISSIR